MDLVILYAQRMKEESANGKDAFTVAVRDSLERIGGLHSVPGRRVSPLLSTCFIRESSTEEIGVSRTVDLDLLKSTALDMIASEGALRIDEFQALETEYNHILHHDPESSVSSALADLLQELPAEVSTQEAAKTVSKPVVHVSLSQLASGDGQAHSAPHRVREFGEIATATLPSLFQHTIDCPTNTPILLPLSLLPTSTGLSVGELPLTSPPPSTSSGPPRLLWL